MWFDQRHYVHCRAPPFRKAIHNVSVAMDESRRIPEMPLSSDQSVIYYGSYEIDRSRLSKGSRRLASGSKEDQETLERYGLADEAEPADATPAEADMFRRLLRERAPMIQNLVHRTHGLQETISASRAEDTLDADFEESVAPARGHPGTDRSSAPRGRRSQHARKERQRHREDRQRARFPEPVPTAGLCDRSAAEPAAPSNEPTANHYLAEEEQRVDADKYLQSFRLYGPMIVQLHKYTSHIMSERIAHAVWMNYVCELAMPLVDRPARSFHSRLCMIIEQPMFIDRVTTASYHQGVLRLVGRFQQYPKEERDRNLRLLHGKTFGDLISQNNFSTYIQDFLSVYFEFEFVEQSTVDQQQVWARKYLPPETDFNACVPTPEKLFSIPTTAKALAEHPCRLVSARFVWYEVGMQ